jgi:hypothetical protein
MSPKLPEPTPDRSDAELEQARELLARTVRFLTRCAEDPEAAMGSEDPRELIRGLQALAAERKPIAELPADRPPIQIRRRRSA